MGKTSSTQLFKVCEKGSDRFTLNGFGIRSGTHRGEQGVVASKTVWGYISNEWTLLLKLIQGHLIADICLKVIIAELK